MIIKASGGVSRHLCPAFTRASEYSSLAVLPTPFVLVPIVVFFPKLPSYDLFVFVASHEVPAAFIANIVYLDRPLAPHFVKRAGTNDGIANCPLPRRSTEHEVQEGYGTVPAGHNNEVMRFRVVLFSFTF